MANNELDFATLAALVQSLGGSADPAVIEAAVNDWLDAHPEATTTVEDGSITKAKLDSNLAGAIDDVSELKTQIDDLSTATSLDVGKALSPKTVTNGKVTEWQYKAIGGGGGGGAVEDVQINGTSIVDGEGVANVPIADANTKLGLVQWASTGFYGVVANNAGRLYIYNAPESDIKAGTSVHKPITPSNQDAASFYGLAKAAGADMKNIASSTVGQYPEAQKAAIQTMLDVPSKAEIDSMKNTLPDGKINIKVTDYDNYKSRRSTGGALVQDAKSCTSKQLYDFNKGDKVTIAAGYTILFCKSDGSYFANWTTGEYTIQEAVSAYIEVRNSSQTNLTEEQVADIPNVIVTILSIPDTIARAEIEENSAVINAIASVCFVAENGSDTNDGSKSYPFATVGKAITAGYKNICCFLFASTNAFADNGASFSYSSALTSSKIRGRSALTTRSADLSISIP